jgi:hypothetical protein
LFGNISAKTTEKNTEMITPKLNVSEFWGKEGIRLEGFC